MPESANAQPRVPPRCSTIAILGGTGSFGQAMTQFLLTKTPATIRIISRDEDKHRIMKDRFAPDMERLRFMLGDIRDINRMNTVLFGVDLVFAAAALKYVDGGEYDPEEFIETNINGTRNVLHACMNNQVARAIFLSSDKAVRSANLYGNCKAVSEKLWIRGNGYAPQGTVFVALRYGNVLFSRGSILPKWRACLQEGGPLPITELRMTRFLISLSDAVALAWFAATQGPRGSILIPHLPAYSMRDMHTAFCEESSMPLSQARQIPVRPGEKWHEELIAPDEEARLAVYRPHGVMPHYYCVEPMLPTWEVDKQGADCWEPWQLPGPYASDVWPYRLSVKELRERIREDI